jgi:hypothetical protein
MNELVKNNHISISDFKDHKIPTFGLKYIAEESGCKSSYIFAIKSIDDKFIGVLGSSSIGGVLMTHLDEC